MDLFKYIVFVFIFITIIGMGQLFNNDQSTWNDFIDGVQEDNLQIHAQNTSTTMASGDIVYNPQNENTQSEGLGGIGISTITVGVFKFFGTTFENIGNQQAKAKRAQADTNPFNSMINWAIYSFFGALLILLIIKGYQFLRFGN